MTNDQATLETLLQKLEDLHRAGAPISLAGLCQQTPDLLPELERRWTERRKELTDALIKTRSIIQEDTAPETKTFIQDPYATIYTSSSITQTPKTTHSTSRERFQNEQKHKEGGLGVVYRAEDIELKRTVALKQIKPARDHDPDKRARFIREAEITGGLEHPGIVPIYSLGADEEGRPFYAMRFIQGKSLSDAIREFHNKDGANKTPSSKKRSPAERILEFRKLLTRFIGVCQALAYAHSKNILHRDLKPDNIMLGEFGETLVVDWGLAKRLQEQERASSTSSTTQTPGDDGLSNDGAVMGTPHFMSPEQAAGAAQLTAASDVYSLGATLYAILTGKPPFQGDPLKIIEQVKQGAFTPPRHENSTTSKPLNAICLKAMATRPEDRYPNAAILAEELEKHLADEPVIAYQETAYERTRRWMRKHPKMATSISVALIMGILAVSGFGGFASYKNAQLARANLSLDNKNRELDGKNKELDSANKKEQRARQVAEQEQGEAESVTSFLVNSFRMTDPDQDGKSLTVYDSLTRSLKEIEERRDMDPLNRAAILNAMFLTFEGLALPSDAFQAAKSAYEITRDELGEENQETIAALGNLGMAYKLTGQVKTAIPMLRKTVDFRLANLGPLSEETLKSQSNLAMLYLEDGQYQSAVLLLAELERKFEEKFGPADERTISCRNNLALAYSAVGNANEALTIFERMLKAVERVLPQDHPDVLQSQNNLAMGYAMTGRLDLAIPLLEKALVGRKAKLGEDHLDTLETQNNLGYVYTEQGKVELATQHLIAALEGRRKKLGDQHPIVLEAQNNLAHCYIVSGNNAAAIPVLEKTLDALKAVNGEDHPKTLITQSNLAAAYQATGQADRAITLLKSTLEVRLKVLGPTDPAISRTKHNLAKAYSTNLQLDLAIPLLQEALSGFKSNGLDDFHPSVLATTHLLAVTYLQTGNQVEANELVQGTLARIRVLKDRDHLSWLNFAMPLIAELLKFENFTLAQTVIQEALELCIVKEPDLWSTFNTRSLLGAALLGQKKWSEAEPLLLAGFEGLEKRQDEIPAQAKVRLTEAAQRLADLYKAMDKPEETAKWQAKFEELNKKFPLPIPPNQVTPTANTTPPPLPAESQPTPTPPK